jgi:adenylyl cyclase-associated protein
VGAPTTSSSAPAAPPPLGPPRTALEPGGRKWVIENYTPDNCGGGGPITLAKATPSQAVAITSCSGVTIDIPGKVNAVCVDGCAGVGVRLGTVVASVELVNGTKVGLEVTGSAPTVAVDGCRGVTLFLSPAAAAGTDVTTAQSSEVNIVLAGGEGDSGDADPVELAVPEQFVSRVVGGRLVTTPVAHSGA